MTGLRIACPRPFGRNLTLSWNGSRPKRPLRQRVTCSDPAGVEAWIYTWNRPTDGFTRLAGGSWRAAAPPAALL